MKLKILPLSLRYPKAQVNEGPISYMYCCLCYSKRHRQSGTDTPSQEGAEEGELPVPSKKRSRRSRGENKEPRNEQPVEPKEEGQRSPTPS